VSDESGSLPHDAPAGDVTLRSYEAGADAYLQQSPPPGTRVRAYLDQLADLVVAGTVLELGSGPGWEAAYLESRGPRVVRTDAVNAFVDLLLAAGHPARLLDVRVDDFGGPYDAVMANAVLLHLSREQLSTCWVAPVARLPTTACWHSRSKKVTVSDGVAQSSGYLAISPIGGNQSSEARLRPTAGRCYRSSMSPAASSRGCSLLLGPTRTSAGSSGDGSSTGTAATRWAPSSAERGPRCCLGIQSVGVAGVRHAPCLDHRRATVTLSFLEDQLLPGQARCSNHGAMAGPLTSIRPWISVAGMPCNRSIRSRTGGDRNPSLAQ